MGGLTFNQWQNTFYLSRPLTQEQISERSEMARKRHAEKQAMLSEGKSEEKGEQDALNRGIVLMHHLYKRFWKLYIYSCCGKRL